MAEPKLAKLMHESGTRVRLQTFVIVRDSQRRVALMRLEGIEGWCLAGETMLLGESPDEAAVRVAKSWFASPVGMAMDRVLSFPPVPGDDSWYLLFVYEGETRGALDVTPDTLEVQWVTPGETPPGPFAMAHADVWASLLP